MKKVNKNNKFKINFKKTIENVFKIFLVFFVVVFLPFFAEASEVKNYANIEQNLWKEQKNNIIKNINKEIYLNHFLIRNFLKQKINNLQYIKNKENFILSVKNIYLEIDKYYVKNTNHKNTNFQNLRKKILQKIENFSQIENLRVDEKFKNDLKILETVKSQKLFLKRLDSFFNKHIKDFSLKSTKINKK